MADPIITSVMVAYFDWQQILLVIVGAVAGFLSILGSSAICYSILLNSRKILQNKLQQVQYRYLLALSLSDILTSAVFLVWPLPIPQSIPFVFGNHFGNTTTCSVQGFLLQLSSIGMFYNGALCHWFYCTIVKSMTDRHYQAMGYERRWHILAILFPIATGILAVSTEHMNYTPMGCWVGSHPYGCLYDDLVDCERGKHWVAMAWGIMGLPLNLMMMVVGWYMYQIHQHVKVTIGKAQAHIERTSQLTAASGGDIPRISATSVPNETEPATHEDDEDAGGRPSATDEECETETGTGHETTTSSSHDDEMDPGNGNDSSLTSRVVTSSTRKRVSIAEEAPEVIPTVADIQPDEDENDDNANDNTPTEAQEGNSSHEDADPSTRSSNSKFRISKKSLLRFQSKSFRVEQSLSGALQESYSKMRQRKRETAVQGYWYIGIYIFTHQFNLLYGILAMFGVRQPFAVIFLCQATWPLQGLMNAFVFVRTKLAAIQSQHPTLPYPVAFYCSIFYYDEAKHKLLPVSQLPQWIVSRLQEEEA